MKKLFVMGVVALFGLSAPAWGQTGIDLPGSGAGSGALQDGNENPGFPRTPRTPRTPAAAPAAQPETPNPLLQPNQATPLPLATPNANEDERDDAADPASDNLPSTGLPVWGLGLLGIGLAAVGGAARELSLKSKQ